MRPFLCQEVSEGHPEAAMTAVDSEDMTVRPSSPLRASACACNGLLQIKRDFSFIAQLLILNTCIIFVISTLSMRNKLFNFFCNRSLQLEPLPLTTPARLLATLEMLVGRSRPPLMSSSL